MKWKDESGYRIHSICLEREEAERDEPGIPPNHAMLFRDMYRLRIHGTALSLTFLPMVNRPSPEDFRAAEESPFPSTAEELYAESIMCARAVVAIGNESRSPEFIELPVIASAPNLPTRSVPIFRAARTDYEQYLDELDLLSNRPLPRMYTTAHYDDWQQFAAQYPIGPHQSMIQHLAVIQFIDAVFLSSHLLTDEERRRISAATPRGST